ncbi:hypothetical protein [Streptomyces sp. adm13(2018)]|uniref:hypothetical protein n=1 Tax=Streptomyces sp. adm13(2018) TaxID=2479007 RepID=UPI0016503FE4|nr:hypothetical protein [Streptomyces sp. adm13(2018)]
MTADEPRRLVIVPPPYPKTTPGFCETGNPMCGEPARLYAAGWRCPAHRPSTPKYDAA